MRKLAAAFMVLALAGSATAQNTQTPSVDVTVDLSRPGAPIARQIYGHFAEHLGRGIYEASGSVPAARFPIFAAIAPMS